MSPGEVYLADLDDSGSRPVIVVSRESLNRGGYVVVVACTSSNFAYRSSLPNCVPFLAGQFGFSMDCVAQCEGILAIDVGRIGLSAGPIGVLDAVTFREVVRAIGFVIGSECEPE